ncbi:MAG: hypothetical protein NC203_00415 [Firmicutes bacterium]|nr:hypothetical protein [[Eubacterium] siraeum]MCM1486802.1 hypothetical protein [Bacillota bacterium]
MAVPRKKVKRKGKNSGLTAEVVNEKAKRKDKTATEEAASSEDAVTVPVGRAGQVIFSLQAGTPIFVKTADICAATGKTNQWIGQLTSQGIINKTQTSHGALYSFFETMKAYCAMIEDRAKKLDEDSEAIEKRKKQAETKLKESKALMEEMKVKEFQGKMHRSEDVQAMTADLLFYIRGSLMALAGRCATECAASSEPAEVQKIIEREVFLILKELSDYKYSKKRYEECVRRRESIFDENAAEDDEE